jgi:hypothetical protein
MFVTAIDFSELTIVFAARDFFAGMGPEPPMFGSGMTSSITTTSYQVYRDGQPCINYDRLSHKQKLTCFRGLRDT